MTRPPLACRHCGEPLATIRPKRGTVAVIHTDLIRWQERDTLILICPRCDRERTVTLRPSHSDEARVA